MRCDFCGYEFTAEEAPRGCGNCPVKAGCRMVKCPRCNYEIPPEPGWVRWIKRLVAKG